MLKINTKKVMLLLAEKRMTQTQVAEKSGILKQNLGVILRRGACTPITAGKLAAGLGVPVIDIVAEES